jgi:hypothetical protein
VFGNTLVWAHCAKMEEWHILQHDEPRFRCDIVRVWNDLPRWFFERLQSSWRITVFGGRPLHSRWFMPNIWSFIDIPRDIN